MHAILRGQTKENGIVINLLPDEQMHYLAASQWIHTCIAWSSYFPSPEDNKT